MNKILSFLIISIISIFSYSNIDSSKFSDIEVLIKRNSEFVESGVKVSYTTNNSVANELKLIEKNINLTYKNLLLDIQDDSIQATSNSMNIFAQIFIENKQTKVEINIINYDKLRNVYDLMKELTKLQSNNIKNIKYYKYLKGKINNKEIVNTLSEKNYLKDIDILNIHNGYVGTANLFNGERVNFAYCNYNTDTYFIIGTPIIYTTY